MVSGCGVLPDETHQRPAVPGKSFVFGAAGDLMPGMNVRQAQVRRVTRETRIRLNLKLDGTGRASVKTGLPFLDHMLALFAKHAVVDVALQCDGDLEVDAHHTV